MKFVAVALALLLAVGSQAATLQADAPAPPSQLEHVRAAVDVYMTQVKDGANRALSQLDDTEYKELKDTLSQRLEDLHTQIKTWQTVVAPMTDNVVATITDATAEFRTSLLADIDTLKAEIAPNREALKEVLDKHIAEYRAQLDPIIAELHTKFSGEVEGLKTKLQPITEELKAKVATNVEETKNALMPIVETVRAKLSERLEGLKSMATPYVDEYKDQLKQAYSQAQTVNTADITALREKIEPLAEEIKVKLQTIFETIAASITKN